MWSKSNSKSRMTVPTNQKKKPPQKHHNNTTNTDFCGKATIFDLQTKDKEKIGNLIRKVVELDNKNKHTQKQAKETQIKLKKQVTALQSQNNEIIKQHTKLRSKFHESLRLLKNYQIKLNQMNALQSIKLQQKPQNNNNNNKSPNTIATQIPPQNTQN
eukprot:226147_1